MKVFVNYLVKKKIKLLGINPMQNYTQEGFTKKDAEYIVNLLIKTIKYGAKKRIKISGSWNTLFYKLSYPSFSYCGGIGKEFSVEPNGDIYPCSAILIKLGSILNLEKIPESKQYLNLLNRSIPFLKDCRGCEIEGICGGGCSAESIFTKKDITAHAPDCYLRKYLVERMLKEENAKLFSV
jgi:radical SAM protein with 4Fe4S-binding SPASM domain